MKTLLLLLAKNFPFFVVATGIYLIPSPEKIGFIISPHRIRNAATLAILDKITLIVGEWAVVMGFSYRWTIITSIIGYMMRPFIMAEIAAGITHDKVSKYKIWSLALVNALIVMSALFTDVVFTYDTDRTFHRGFLGFWPHITCCLYLAYYIYLQIRAYVQNEWKSDNFVVIVFTIVSLIAASFETLGVADDVLDNTILVAATFTHIYNYIQYTNRDPLTFLLNRQAYYEYISSNAARVTGLISVDMNGLKGINDTLGHAAGDEALSEIGNVLKKTQARGTQIYRMGGDEFTILCTMSDENDMVEIVDDIKKELKKTKYTCSIGYAVQSGNKSLDELNHEADQKMYGDKQKYYMTHERRR